MQKSERILANIWQIVDCLLTVSHSVKSGFMVKFGLAEGSSQEMFFSLINGCLDYRVIVHA